MIVRKKNLHENIIINSADPSAFHLLDAILNDRVIFLSSNTIYDNVIPRISNDVLYLVTYLCKF